MTQDELKSLVRYEDGCLFWLERRKGINISLPIGSVGTSCEYARTTINYVRYQTHHLVWLYFNGELPSGVLDHINGIKTDNRIENLREVTVAENAQNLYKANHDNRSGYLGVTYRPDRKKNPYRANIKVGGKAVILGQYPTAEEAHQVYLTAKAQLHPFGEVSKEYRVN